VLSAGSGEPGELALSVIGPRSGPNCSNEKGGYYDLRHVLRKDTGLSIFPTRILLATDGSAHAALAATTAIDLAKSTNSRLHVVAVGRTFPTAVYDVYTKTASEDLRREAQEILDEQVRKIEEAGGTVAVAHLKMDERRDEAIVHLAEDIGAGLIVIGSRGFGGMKRALMGNVADSVVRHAHCPVLVVRPTQGTSRPF
jgi:nucleotide-binding universal stress UspA family protein